MSSCNNKKGIKIGLCKKCDKVTLFLGDISMKLDTESFLKHAEVVKIEFDTRKISYENILCNFFEMHDPTTLNRQGPDTGTQYRSEIFFLNEKQEETAKKVLTKYNNKYNGKITTKISPIKNYCKAEEYHQKYLEKNF